MFYSIMQAESLCDSDPSLIFSLINEGDKEVLDKIISKDGFDFNYKDKDGNNIIMYLLKTKHYDLALKYIDKVDINHQNNDGDTLAHILVGINYLNVKEIIEYVFDNKDFIPNIKNKLGETILDKSINNNYLYTTIKILENKRFNSIDVYSFKHLYETYIKSNNYGKYSKLSNLEVILDNLETKRLLPRMEKLINLIQKDLEIIKNDFNLSKTEKLDNIINLVIMDAIN
ncbi:MAG: hypothetical protein IJ501_04990 [Bacilli bacterium]|nr:hypothetical protein [Bacilli bacterium]